MSPATVISNIRTRFFSGDSLRSSIASATFWSLLGYGGGQFLRFASNVVLTRLLVPDAFGLMMLVNVYMQGLAMFSDTGAHVSLVQNPRGKDPLFVRTAFTLNVIRGCVLFVVASILAFPAAEIWRKPELLTILPVASIQLVVLGFRSTRFFLAQRDLEYRRLVLMQLAVQVATIVVMTVWAWLSPTVWSLVAGLVAGAVLDTLGSHLLLPGQPDRFAWDKSAASELIRFGRWILASTALTFLAGRGDALLMGRFMTAAELGIFSLASNLARLIQEALRKVIQDVMFPAYARIFRERPHDVRRVVARMRGMLLPAAALAYAPLAVLGSWLVDIIYDDRYMEAGWMLQILACGLASEMLAASYNGILNAQGKAHMNTYLQAVQVAIKFAAMAFGFQFLGVSGVILAVAFNSLLSLPATFYFMHRVGVLNIKFDLLATAAFVVAIAVFFWLVPLPSHIFVIGDGSSQTTLPQLLRGSLQSLGL